MSNKQDTFKMYYEKFVNSRKNNLELEVRFGTKGKRITKIDFDNVIQKLLSAGFEIEDPSLYMLRIQTEYYDKITGKTKTSNIRTEIDSFFGVQDYCLSNDLYDKDGHINREIGFIRKSQLKQSDFQKRDDSDDKESAPMRPIDFDDFGFRVSLQEEKRLNPETDNILKQTVDDWKNLKKVFRLLKRTTFVHPLFPVRIDMSVVRSSSLNKRGYFISEYTLDKSNVFNNPVSYELEIEVLKHKATRENFGDIQKTIQIIMSSLQGSNFPISRPEQFDVLKEYYIVINGRGGDDEEVRVKPKHFVGPSPISLQLENIQPLSETNNAHNIRKNYTVTEKADGIRKLLYVSKKKDGKVYLIDQNMNVQFTGLKTDKLELMNSLFDGEHIINNKLGEFYNVFACFDVYMRGGDDVRSLPFYEASNPKVRHAIMTSSIKELNASYEKKSASAVKITTKRFYAGDGDEIFERCRTILSDVEANKFEYITDGLIFTPADMAVGGDVVANVKKTWEAMFKWKPPEFNTIDFLVSTKKNDQQNDYVGNIFNEGTSTHKGADITQYKSLILRVGFDEKKHGYLNPAEDVIEDRIPSYKENLDDEETYKPIPFYPTKPYDPNACKCNVMLTEGSYSVLHMMTEDKTETFEDDTIVEFRYDKTREPGFNWIPIRVRYDKTAEYKAGGKNYGNAYHVAESVWRTIHDPITTQMITSGRGIPDIVGDDDVYYNRSGDSKTRALRDFHNLYVKRKVIMSVSHPGNRLIDLTVGKGGDFSKWIASKLSFVFGVDVARDNIENRLDGACARYLNYKKNTKAVPGALFVHANSGLNIRSGEACFTDKGREIVRAVFGEGPKDEKKLGRGVYKNYGQGEKGFNVVSCQFALHYFFENVKMLHNFLRNVSECCRIGGYFIGTCYDGREVFKMLEDKKQGESVSQHVDGKKIWEVIKQYDSDTLENDATSVGMAIDVYQETINKTFREYLVNFNYLDKLMYEYGFEKASSAETKGIGGRSVGTFTDCYYLMKSEINKDPELEKEYGRSMDMTSAEKTVSFLNNYFIYKKVRDVDAKNVMEVHVGTSASEEIAAAEVAEIPKSKKNKSRKLVGKKVKLVIMSDEESKVEAAADEAKLVVNDAGDISSESGPTTFKIKPKKTTVKKRAKTVEELKFNFQSPEMYVPHDPTYSPEKFIEYVEEKRKEGKK